MNKTADAIIIGAGVIGSAIAFELSKMGLKSLSLDRNTQIGQGLDCRFVCHYPNALFHL